MAKNPYITKIDTLVEQAPINQTWQSVQEAKCYIKAISQLKKELGLIKKELTMAKRQIHASAASQRAHVGKGFTGGAMRGIFGAKIAGSANASVKNNMRNQELKALEPYQEAEQYLARILAGLDRLKLQIDSWLIHQK